MKYQIKFARQAVRDMDKVWADVFSASKSYDVASRYLNDLQDAIENKSEFPKSGIPLYYEDVFTGYYFIVFKAYLVFYRVENTMLLVDRILYGKSDYLRKLYVHSSKE